MWRLYFCARWHFLEENATRRPGFSVEQLWDRCEQVFRLSRPTSTQIEALTARARDCERPASSLLPLGRKPEHWKPPAGFAHDERDSYLGAGEQVFAAAKRAFARWAEFDLGWVRVANPDTAIAKDEVVALEVMSFGLFSLNISRITATIDTPERFGFVYATTEMHIERGEERFLLRMDRETGEVRYELEALSIPRNTLARIGYPVTRAFQHRFARDSHRRMKEAIEES